MRRITKIAVDTDKRLSLTYDNGETVSIDFNPIISKGKVFTLFKDDNFFGRVKIGENGRSIEWPDDIYFCADALWLAGHDDEYFTHKTEAVAK